MVFSNSSRATKWPKCGEIANKTPAWLTKNFPEPWGKNWLMPMMHSSPLMWNEFRIESHRNQFLEALLYSDISSFSSTGTIIRVRFFCRFSDVVWFTNLAPTRPAGDQVKKRVNASIRSTETKPLFVSSFLLLFLGRPPKEWMDHSSSRRP